MISRATWPHMKDRSTKSKKSKNGELVSNSRKKIRQLNASGYPTRTERGDIYGAHRNLSGVSRQQLDIRYPKPLVSKTYHDDLTEQVVEKNQMKYRTSERDLQEKKQHGITMSSYFWKPVGHGAPYPEREKWTQEVETGQPVVAGL